MASPQPIDWKKRLRPKAYAIGVYVVAFFIVVELVVLASAFWIRQRVVLETEGPSLVEKIPEPEKGTLDPQLPPPTFEARLALDQGPTAEIQIARLNDEAREFRRNGNFVMAEAALNKALEIERENPLTLTNLAMLEEARGNNNRALEYWRQIIRMGDRARDTIQLARERSVIIEERLRLEEENLRRTQLGTDRVRPIRIGTITSQPDPLPPRPKEIQRDFAFTVSPDAPALQGSKLRIQVYFYERIGADRLVTVPIETQFLNPSPVWRPGAEETLRVRYVAQDSAEPRQYYGYLLRIFYDGVLQDEKAEPTSLLRLNPVR